MQGTQKVSGQQSCSAALRGRAGLQSSGRAVQPAQRQARSAAAGPCPSRTASVQRLRRGEQDRSLAPARGGV